jgi:hypothetical protein
MSGDLEDFLRRAAQRRQAKAAQQQQQQPTPRQRPQYSNRQTERRVRSEQPEEVLTAEIVEEDPNSYSARTKRVEEAKRAAKKAEAEVAEALRKAGGARASKASSVTVALTGQPTLDLLAMLRQPVGIQQAILLREILDRPEHRW